jgi:hypothetical protein
MQLHVLCDNADKTKGNQSKSKWNKKLYRIFFHHKMFYLKFFHENGNNKEVLLKKPNSQIKNFISTQLKSHKKFEDLI